MTKIKICGLMTKHDIKAVNQARPDLAGFIFAKGRHQIDLKTALILRKLLDPSIPSVGVFVNAPVEAMLKIYNSGAISMIQLHGQESENTVKTLQAQNIPIIKAFKPFQNKPQTNADYLMLDSGSGNGMSIDWQKIQIKTKQPLIIAGSLDINNVTTAIRSIHPNYVDLSRGVETNNIKDPQKILKIVTLVHQL